LFTPQFYEAPERAELGARIDRAHARGYRTVARTKLNVMMER
jgi:hypothetical protein